VDIGVILLLALCTLLNMAIVRTRPQKDNPTDGSEEPFDHNSDAVDARGVYVQNDTSDNTSVLISRDASNNMTFADGVVSGTKTLTELLNTGAAHEALLNLIHFIDEGPAKGFATGATKTVTGGIFPSNISWFRADTKLLIKQTITWSGPVPTVIKSELFGSDGTTILETIQDTITYSGIFEVSRVRAIS